MRHVVLQRRGALSALPDSKGKSGGDAASALNPDKHARDEKLTKVMRARRIGGSEGFLRV
jgi:hypothetical protein